jgi:hypothetical protein
MFRSVTAGEIGVHLWHRAVMRGRPAFAAGLSVVMLVVTQLAAHAHEAAVRHVTCGEHGEQLEAAIVAAHPDDGIARWVAVELDGGEHAQCLIANALQQSGISPAHVQSPVALAVVADAQLAPVVVPVPIAALYRLAPKTSPPVGSVD